MRLHAFQGTRYIGAPEVVGRLAAPAADQLDAARRDRLRASGGRHFTHLVAPVPDGDVDAWAHAAVLASTWQSDGTLLHDAQPSLYPYVILMPGGRRRLGICGLVGFEDPATGVLRPVDRRAADPADADRAALLQATKTDLEPALVLAAGADGLEPLIAGDARTAVPVASHVDADGNLHLLYRNSDPARIADYQASLAEARGAIAGGDAGFRVASRYASRNKAKAGSAAAAKLAVVTSLTSSEVAVAPIHRGLRDLPDLDPARPLARRVDMATPVDGRAFAAAVAAAPQPAIGFLRRDAAIEIWQLSPRAATAAPESAVTLLHEVIWPALGLGVDAGSDGRTVHQADAAALWQQVTTGELALGIFLPPLSPSDLAAAIASNRPLPPRSTLVAPGLMSGLVWSDHSSDHVAALR
jgi:uncharacterized protein (DUF1015 family)